MRFHDVTSWSYVNLDDPLLVLVQKSGRGPGIIYHVSDIGVERRVEDLIEGNYKTWTLDWTMDWTMDWTRLWTRSLTAKISLELS